MEAQEFVAYYQPQVDIGYGSVIGIEALLRWRHPILGLVCPDRFMPQTENTELIFKVDEWMLRSACRQCRRWMNESFAPFRITVNLSARQFQDKWLPELVSNVLNETGLDSKYLGLEITESSAMKDPNHTISALNALKQMGVQISLDDFGTGYSSLSYLHKFPVDNIKIDRSFIHGTIGNPNSEAIITGIVDIAHYLKKRVLVEGVETREQLSFLDSIGCDEIQGFLMSMPLPEEKMTELLLELERTGGFENIKQMALNKELTETMR